MSWRSLVISHPARLSFRDQQLLIEQQESVTVPLEDIAVIVLETPQTRISGYLLAALAEHGIALLVCGADHLPNGILLPFLQHSRQTRVFRLQIGMSKPLKKRLWRRIVRAKLRNQAACLQGNGAKPTASLLQRMATEVKSGDPQNLESQAAQRYFPALFGKGFRRSADTLSNASLNYGYAVFRGAVARALVLHGFIPMLGIHHSSELNAFNLADDLLEPWRPMVDQLVAATPELHQGDQLTATNKPLLVGLLHQDVGFNDGRMTVLAAIEQMAASLLRASERGDHRLLDTPTLSPTAPPLFPQ